MNAKQLYGIVSEVNGNTFKVSTGLAVYDGILFPNSLKVGQTVAFEAKHSPSLNRIIVKSVRRLKALV